VPDEVPFGRWGRVSSPPVSEGAYVFVEKESGEGWKVEPPDDAVRVWHRKPVTAEDDDTNNWTVWFHRHQLHEWMRTYVVTEWLPEGVEPSWQ
jgi:hypothetical protein